MAAVAFSIYIALAVVVLLLFVALSYQQTVHAYPKGGGSYVVSSENLGLLPGMIAAASLMVDYVMTLAVSVASGVAAITAAFPSLADDPVHPARIPVLLCIALIVLVSIANLRGARESGKIFAIPTYLFVLLCGGLVIAGIVRWIMGDLRPSPCRQAGPRSRAWPCSGSSFGPSRAGPRR